MLLASLSRLRRRRHITGIVMVAIAAAASPASAGQTSYAYDARGRLTGVSRTGTGGYGATYSYDRADNRLSYVVTGSGSSAGPGTPAFAVIPWAGGYRVVPVTRN